MNFGPEHYVPVLKCKRGEKKALGLLDERIQRRIIPLIEIVERRPMDTPTVEQHLKTAFSGLEEATRNFERCFIDTRELASEGPALADAVFQKAADSGITFTPVTGISRTADVHAAKKHLTQGVAVRVTRAEFEAGLLSTKLASFLQLHSLSERMVDLIVDLGAVEDMVPQGIIRLTDAFLAAIPNHESWRTFTVSACAFPQSMKGIERNSHASIDRAEWLAWKNGLHARKGVIKRLPTFSDCAIQHPLGVEGFNPLKMQASATVRYTQNDSWLLIKGVGTKGTPAKEQFPSLARELAYGKYSASFATERHCRGCAFVKQAADGGKGLGSPEKWRQIGTIHHISQAAMGIASLT